MVDLFYVVELEEKIKKYQKSYYENEAEISDAEFDALWDELKTIAPDSDLLKGIGSDVDFSATKTSDGFEKASHLIPMGSQEKAANPEQFLEWANKHRYSEYLVEYKLDGASLELQYENGKFIRAVTRGNGEVGDDITNNALKMPGLVKSLNGAFSGGVRGEVIMTHDVHKNLYSTKANCRNAANGLMKRKDGTGSENLTIICYDAFFTNTDFVNKQSSLKSPFENEKQKIQWLKNAGFNTVPIEICKTPQDVIDYRVRVMDERKSLEYDIDGLVIKNNEIDIEDSFKNRPDKQIAFKFSLEEAITVVKNVIWNENGATYTPIAEFDTVELAGTKVSRASLANPNTIKELGLQIGSKVVVTKRGEIIPKIEYVLKTDETTSAQGLSPLSTKTDETTSEQGLSPLSTNKCHDSTAMPSINEKVTLSPVTIPSKCNTCGSVLQNDGTRLFCPNSKCSKRILHKIEKWISVLDIKEFGTALINRLFESKVLESIYDIYKLNEAVLTNYFLNSESLEKGKESLGAKKVLASIQNSSSMTIEKFIAGFDIEGIGETMIEKLTQAGFSTLDSLLNATASDFEKVYMFAEITAKTLYNGLQENRIEMKKLVDEGLVFIKEKDTKNAKLAGKSFCFTGELFSMKRAEAEQKVKDLGGFAKSSVVKDLSFLVTNDTSSGSSKNKKAQSLGIPIIDEKTFLQMIGE